MIVVSVVSHNSLETLPACLHALQRNLEGWDAETYVVDNLCESRSAPMLRHDFPEVRIIENQRRLGFGANHNQVIQRSQARYFLALNPDVFLPDNAIRTMFDFMEGSPNSAACGPRLVDEAGIPASQTTRLLKPLREIVLLSCYISNIDPNKLTRLEKLISFPGRKGVKPSTSASPEAFSAPLVATAVPCISGACMFFRKDALDEVGGFDERFFLYFEETDWCLRAHAADWQIFMLPALTAVHTGGVSTRPNYLDHLRVYVRSAVAYYDKHHSHTTSMIMAACVRSVAFVNWLRWSIRKKLRFSDASDLEPWIDFSYKLFWKGVVSALERQSPQT